MAFDHLLADRTGKMGVNVIREILKVVAQPGMVSLAGGIPAPESFPAEIIRELTEIVIDKYGSNALQYGPTEGFGPLREVLVDYLGKREITAAAEGILIACGSQGVLDAIGKVLISKGDRVAVEASTYLGALQAFTPYEPEYVSGKPCSRLWTTIFRMILDGRAPRAACFSGLRVLKDSIWKTCIGKRSNAMSLLCPVNIFTRPHRKASKPSGN